MSQRSAMSPNNPSRTSLDRHPTAALQLFNEVIGSTHAALQRERRLLGEASRLACDVAGPAKLRSTGEERLDRNQLLL